ncbi:exostosin domain-containing protein [Pedobacter immunditicola]|uniref:exostosin domain-containing protein n=1 Tax=Pedobacter immunditicola TaxID=3133440 RepID=UPI003095A514
MKIFVTSAYPYDSRSNFGSTYLRESAVHDPFKVHCLADHPEDADLIIFAEHHPYDPYFFKVLRDPVYQKFKHKCYLYHDNDHSLTFLPTVSPSIQLRDYNPLIHRSYAYIFQIDHNHAVAAARGEDHQKKYLFSFIGASRTNPIRKAILSLDHPESYLEDTSDRNSWELRESDKKAYFSSYAQVSLASHFILCPAGISPNSYRLYESMEMGIAPVIISDEWIPSQGPQWESFAIRVSAAEINQIPAILQAKEKDAAAMGKLARQAWLDWFAKDKQFHLLTEACAQLHQHRSKVTASTYLKQYGRFSEPFHFRNLLRFYKNQLKKKLGQAIIRL